MACKFMHCTIIIIVIIIAIMMTMMTGHSNPRVPVYNGCQLIPTAYAFLGIVFVCSLSTESTYGLYCKYAEGR